MHTAHTQVYKDLCPCPACVEVYFQRKGKPADIFQPKHNHGSSGPLKSVIFTYDSVHLNSLTSKCLIVLVYFHAQETPPCLEEQRL